MTPTRHQQYWNAQVVLGLVTAETIRQWAEKKMDQGLFHEQLMYIVDKTSASASDLMGHVRIYAEQQGLNWPSPNLSVWWVIVYWFWEVEQEQCDWQIAKEVIVDQLIWTTPVLANPEGLNAFGLKSVLECEMVDRNKEIDLWLSHNGHWFLE